MVRRIVFTACLLFLMTACAQAQASVRLAWNYTQGTTLATTFIVYKQPNCTGAFAPLATVPVTTLTYTDTAVVAGSTYCWDVTAKAATGEESAHSAPVSFRLPLAPPSAPVGLSGTVVP